MTRKFIGRKRELEALKKRHASSEGQLVLLYGRRRIGKTYLLQHFIAGKLALFHGASQLSPAAELANFTKSVRAQFGNEGLPSGFNFPTWEDALTFLAEHCKERLVVVLDEFPYLAQTSQGLESTIQRWWDHAGRHSSIMLILCGSAQAFMRSLDAALAPLHQRLTAKINVGPLDYRDAALFTPALSPEDKARVYGILGGTPLYLAQWNQKNNLRQNLIDLFADPASMLIESAEIVLSGELAEAEGSFRILQAVALGRTRPSAIKDVAHVAVERPLRRLVELGFLERCVPSFENPLKTRRAYYRVADPYFRFFFRFIAPEQSEIGRGLGEQLVEQGILPLLDDHMGSVFEDIAREHARGLLRRKMLPGYSVGSWWDSNSQHEIDIVGTKGNDVTFIGEAKWSARLLDRSILLRLETHAQALSDSLAGSKRTSVASGLPKEIPRLLYSRSGCKTELLANPSIRFFNAGDLYTEQNND